jgi:hypothetical protein
MRTWMAWKQSFHLAHLKHQHQILAIRGGGEASWGGPRCSSHGGAGNQAVGVCTQQPSPRGNKRLCCSPTAHSGKLCPHYHSHGPDSNQQNVGGLGGESSSGSKPYGNNGKSALYRQTLVQELLLDAQPSDEKGAHKSHLQEQSCWPPR